jgi:hypothetical protein
MRRRACSADGTTALRLMMRDRLHAENCSDTPYECFVDLTAD